MSAFPRISVRRKFRATCYARVCEVTGLSLLALAAAVAAQPATAEFRKAPPDSGYRSYDKRLTALIEQRYPELTAGRPAGIRS